MPNLAKSLLDTFITLVLLAVFSFTFIGTCAYLLEKEDITITLILNDKETREMLCEGAKTNVRSSHR